MADEKLLRRFEHKVKAKKDIIQDFKEKRSIKERLTSYSSLQAELSKNLNVEYKNKNTRNVEASAAAALFGKPDTLIDQNLYSLRSNEEKKDEM